MAWYRCVARGENFPLSLQGRVQPTGFFATRYVEADSEAAAEAGALDLFRNAPDLQIAPGTPGAENARIFFESIERVETPGTPNAGFTFFIDEEE